MRGFDRALFCLVNGEIARRCRRAWEWGPAPSNCWRNSTLPVSIRAGPLAAALLGKEDVFVDVSSPVRYACPLFTNVAKTSNFGILPLIVNGIVAGCLYFDSAAEGFVLDARKRKALLELRGFAVTAIARKRQNGR